MSEKQYGSREYVSSIYKWYSHTTGGDITCFKIGNNHVCQKSNLNTCKIYYLSLYIDVITQ